LDISLVDIEFDSACEFWLENKVKFDSLRYCRKLKLVFTRNNMNYVSRHPEFKNSCDKYTKIVEMADNINADLIFPSTADFSN